MTAEEKAWELVYIKFDFASTGNNCESREDVRSLEANDKQLKKRCALICVDEIINIYPKLDRIGINYWQQVNQEIKKL